MDLLPISAPLRVAKLTEQLRIILFYRTLFWGLVPRQNIWRGRKRQPAAQVFQRSIMRVANAAILSR
jgi:hypothetical protein